MKFSLVQAYHHLSLADVHSCNTQISDVTEICNVPPKLRLG